MKVVVVSPDLRLLSATALSLAALLTPLEWAGPLIPVLPRKLFGFLGLHPAALAQGRTHHSTLADRQDERGAAEVDERCRWASRSARVQSVGDLSRRAVPGTQNKKPPYGQKSADSV